MIAVIKFTAEVSNEIIPIPAGPSKTATTLELMMLTKSLKNCITPKTPVAFKIALYEEEVVKKCYSIVDP